jgi:hypothetical protein
MAAKSGIRFLAAATEGQEILQCTSPKRPSQSPIQEALCTSSKQPELVAIYVSSSNACVKSLWSYTSTPNTHQHGGGKDIFTFTFSACKHAVHFLSFGVFLICGAVLCKLRELLHMKARYIHNDILIFTVVLKVYTELHFRFYSKSNIIQKHTVYLSTCLHQTTLNLVRSQSFGVLPCLHLQDRRNQLLSNAVMDTFPYPPPHNPPPPLKHAAERAGQNKRISGQTTEPRNNRLRRRSVGVATALLTA